MDENQTRIDFTPMTLYYKMLGESEFKSSGLLREVSAMVMGTKGETTATSEDKQQLWELIVDYVYDYTFATSLFEMARRLTHLKLLGLCRGYSDKQDHFNQRLMVELFRDASYEKSKHLSYNTYWSYKSKQNTYKTLYIGAKKRIKKILKVTVDEDLWDIYQTRYQLYKDLRGKELYVVLTRNLDVGGIVPVKEDSIVETLTEQQKFFYQWADTFKYIHFYRLDDVMRFVDKKNNRDLYDRCVSGLLDYVELCGK